MRFLFCVAIIAIYHLMLNFRIIFSFFANLFKVLKPFVIGGVISFLFFPICKKVENLLLRINHPFIFKRVRSLATAIVIVFSVVFIFSFFFKIVPKLYEAVLKFSEDMSYSISKSYVELEEKTQNIEFLNGLLKEFENQFSFDNLTKIFVSLDYRAYFGGIANFVFKIFNFFIGFIISIYILLERYNIKKNVLRFLNVALKGDTTNRIKDLWRKSKTIIYTFIFGQILDAFIVGCSLGIVLSILRIKNSVVLAFIYFVLAIIPYFGSITAVILIGLFTYVGGDFNKFLTALIVSFVLQQIDSNIINPKIVGQVVGIKPLYVILGISLFGGIFGIVGLFLGPPLMVVCLEFLDEIVKAKELKKKLKDKSVENKSFNLFQRRD